MTLKCDLDLESVLPSHKLCTSIHGEEHLGEFNENRPKGSGDMKCSRNSMVNPLTLTCDLDLESR